MTKTADLHPIQTHILSTLLFADQERFSALNPGTVSNDHFTFHLRRLRQIGLVEKGADARYRLTSTGKEFANRLEPGDVSVTRQAKIGVNVVAVRKHAGRKQYLVQRRLKHPYFGFYGFITDPIRWGETVYEAAERELLRETGLRGRFRMAGVEHRLDYLSDGELQEDKFFYVVIAEALGGTFRQPDTGGENRWMTEKEILRLPKKFQGLEKTLAMVRAGRFSFIESRLQYHREDY
jgi:8-oxo-dGTP diphosphatase